MGLLDYLADPLGIFGGDGGGSSEGQTAGPRPGISFARGWQYGSEENQGIYGQKRVTQYDKIRATDINELRDSVEVLWNHTHDYQYDGQNGGLLSNLF